MGLRTLRHGVEALPRLTLTVAQLKNDRDAQLALSGGQWNPEESLRELKGLVPDSVLHQLAPFQRDAVAFVIEIAKAQKSKSHPQRQSVQAGDELHPQCGRGRALRHGRHALNDYCTSYVLFVVIALVKY